MRVVVLASQKGGSGKTTLAGHLAVQAELSGAGPVALIDTDPQGSLAKWWNARAAETPAFVGASFENLHHDLEALRQQGFKLVFIDTPPAVTKAIAHVVSYADLVVLPTRPSPHDLRAVGATVEIADAHNKAMVFVINAATARAKITSEAAVALSQHGTVAPVMLNHRVDFAASMTDGRTVMEYGANGASAKEVRELWDYLLTRLSRLEGAPQEFSDPAGFDFEAPVLNPAPAPQQSTSLVAFAAEAAPQIYMAEAEPQAAVPEIQAEQLPPAPQEPPAQQPARMDAAFEAGMPPPPMRENPQEALLEAVQRLRGELDYPVTLEDILQPDSSRNSADDFQFPGTPAARENAQPRRGLSAQFFNRMSGFGRRA